MRSLFFIAAVLFSIPSFAQRVKSNEVPSVVRMSFKKHFTGIEKVKWEKETPNYEANFRHNGKVMSALFSTEGNWLETETDMKVSQLPAKVKKYILGHYKGAHIKEAATIEKADGSRNYEAEVNGTDVIFSATGDFIKTQKD